MISGCRWRSPPAGGTQRRKLPRSWRLRAGQSSTTGGRLGEWLVHHRHCGWMWTRLPAVALAAVLLDQEVPTVRNFCRRSVICRSAQRRYRQKQKVRLLPLPHCLRNASIRHLHLSLTSVILSANRAPCNLTRCPAADATGGVRPEGGRIDGAAARGAHAEGGFCILR